MTRFDPTQVGWRIGTSYIPSKVRLWQPWDRTAGVIGPQGSGKTLDILTPALLQAPGAAVVTLTKPDDLLLTITARQAHGPVAVLDPFGAAPGLPELVWDPIDGCLDATVAEKRAKAFCAGTLGSGKESNDSAARFYAAEAAKVIQCYFHAAALAGLTLDDVLQWAASPRTATLPTDILRAHPMAEPHWAGLLAGAVTNTDERTAGNTKSTADQALALFATLTRALGEQQARTIKDLTNTLLIFGGSKDAGFNREISDLSAATRASVRVSKRPTSSRRPSQVTRTW
ncbi:hypothetical protein [Tessaracoccus flavus]|uniref:Uncharacterized protein n=1 Tax=Tessaracoccus flavus TaxID=1610493 RepID=A0A1Q2CFJ9_9ACTN|nr:hypothetical protein [Tessaracoccus flavus]AQP44883.1 hypothetical protein RPIT_08835 [Tessaracoccus flavus]SDY97848.1 type IV secretion system protein VirD4 [Tessaracoccus flavus]